LAVPIYDKPKSWELTATVRDDVLRKGLVHLLEAQRLEPSERCTNPKIDLGASITCIGLVGRSTCMLSVCVIPAGRHEAGADRGAKVADQKGMLVVKGVHEVATSCLLGSTSRSSAFLTWCAVSDVNFIRFTCSAHDHCREWGVWGMGSIDKQDPRRILPGWVRQDSRIIGEGSMADPHEL
jgi:hypothetical protein